MAVHAAALGTEQVEADEGVVLEDVGFSCQKLIERAVSYTERTLEGVERERPSTRSAEPEDVREFMPHAT